MTLIAGLCTGIGSLIAFASKRDNKVFLSVSLGFSAGVMIYVSMIEIFVKAQDSLVSTLGEKNGAIMTVVSFFGGLLFLFQYTRQQVLEKKRLYTPLHQVCLNRLGH